MEVKGGTEVLYEREEEDEDGVNSCSRRRAMWTRAVGMGVTGGGAEKGGLGIPCSGQSMVRRQGK